MTKEKTSKRGWVKNAAIIFLALMLVLTFFSNTIMNRSLPVVSSQYPNSGTITAKIRGSGTVSSNEAYNVTVDQTREVQSVYVRVGDTVTAGQTLFMLADKESDELKTAIDALDTANFDYQNFLLDISATDTNVQSAQQALQKAKNARDKAYSDYTKASTELTNAKKAVEEAQKVYDAIKVQVDAAQKKLDNATKVYNEAELAFTKATAYLEQVQGELTDAQEDLKKPLDDATKELENAKLLLETATTEKSFQEEKLGMTYEAALTARDTAQETLDSLEADNRNYEEQVQSITGSVKTMQGSESNSLYSRTSYLKAFLKDKESQTQNKDITNLNTSLINIEDDLLDAIIGNESTISTLTTERNNLISQIETACYDLLEGTVNTETGKIVYTEDKNLTAISSLNTEIGNAITSLSTLVSSFASVQDKYDTALRDLYNAESVLSDRALKSAMADYEDASRQVKELQIRVNEETIRYNNLIPSDSLEVSDAKAEVTKATNTKTQADYDKTAAQNAFDQISKQLTEPEAKLAAAKADLEAAETAAKADLTEFDMAVTDAQTALGTAVESADITDAKQKLELEQKAKAITDAEQTVEKLTQDASPQEITSKYNGTVTAVAVVAGDKTDPTVALATIEVAEKGYTMTLTVTAEQSRKVSIGDKAELTNYWSYNSMDITLVSITSDRESKGQNKILTFSVEGEDITPGQTLAISIGQKSENYSAIVPNSAVREDSKGKFVYVVESKSSPLGNRYIAKRMDVGVQTSDDTNTAVSGLSGSEFVIVSSTAPLEGNMQVRLSEEQ